MQRVLILSGIQISTNPRVVKEASALTEAGYEVEVVGASLSPASAQLDDEIARGQRWKHTVLVSLNEGGPAGRSRAMLARLRRRAWTDAGSLFRFANIRQFGYSGPEMLAYALRNPADLVIVHLPMAFWVGAKLVKHGQRVAADFEDWYSEDFPGGPGPAHLVEGLRRVERFILERAAYTTSTSRAMSDALARAYSSRAPSVVYNAFPQTERNTRDGKERDRKGSRLPSLHWFSQVVGPGRGLEFLIESLALTQVPFELHLRGRVDRTYSDSLLALAPSNWRERIHFHEPVPHRELLSRIAEHDLSLASEQSVSLSRSLTITNKGMHSLLAGVPVVASSTEGQRELASQADGAVFLYDDSAREPLPKLLDSLFSNQARLKAARTKAIVAATSVLSWENASRTIVELASHALGPGEAGGGSHD